MGWSGRYADFLTALRASLNSQRIPLCLEEADWDFIFDTACHHCVEGVLFDFINNLPADSGISPVLAAKWYSAAGKNEENFLAVTGIVTKQWKSWKEKGIDAVLLKGLESAAFYPVPGHRAIGDIDWWMRTDDDWNRALEVLQDKGINWRTDSDGDISYNVGGIVVEHHRHGLANDGPEGRLLYLADHIFHHAAVYGVGMRQICDYALASRRLTFDRNALHNMAEKDGCGRWIHFLDGVAGVVLDGAEPDSRTAAFLRIVLKEGNFGSGRLNCRRLALVGCLAPRKFLGRWSGLVLGRIKRIL